MEEAGQQKSISKKFSFDEYKLYYESTEKVTDRRCLGTFGLENLQLQSCLSITIIGTTPTEID